MHRRTVPDLVVVGEEFFASSGSIHPLVPRYHFATFSVLMDALTACGQATRTWRQLLNLFLSITAMTLMVVERQN